MRNDHGIWRIPGSKPNSKAWRDWKRWGHGNVDVTKAIEESVDSFFYQTAFDLGIDRISKWMNKFGFGLPTGIDIYEESSANMPTREWKIARHRTPWYQGDTVPIGIGQGYWTATPMQIAKATSFLINHGEMKAPHLLKAVIEHGEDFENQVDVKPKALPSIEGVPEKFWNIPINAMRLVNNGAHGSGRRAFRGAEYSSGGKSGTAQVFGLRKDEVYNSKNSQTTYSTTHCLPRLHHTINPNMWLPWLSSTVMVALKWARRSFEMCLITCLSITIKTTAIR